VSRGDKPPQDERSPGRGGKKFEVESLSPLPGLLYFTYLEPTAYAVGY